MINSILESVKKDIGLDANYTDFDPDIVMHINSTIFVLRQLGVGPENGFVVTGYSETWDDYLEDNKILLAAVPSYISKKVRLLFDPPVGGALDALKATIAELEWRLNVAVDPVRW